MEARIGEGAERREEKTRSEMRQIIGYLPEEEVGRAGRSYGDWRRITETDATVHFLSWNGEEHEEKAGLAGVRETT
jgi:hypothetical protein